MFNLFACLHGEGRPKLDLEYPVYGAHELADEGAFTSVVVLTASFPSGFRRGRDLNPRPSLQGKLLYGRGEKYMIGTSFLHFRNSKLLIK